MWAGTFFALLRILQILTLIPIWGILAYFVNKNPGIENTPLSNILCLFIVAILATAWAIATISLFYRRHLPMWAAIIDLCFFGALIAGVVLLAPWAQDTNCVGVNWNWGWGYMMSGYWNKECSMYKAAYALGILNILMFSLTAVLAAWIWRKHTTVVVYRY
ncbi:hypothetical protein L873DRAFT_1831372 [Choiromyces venosus 120613-1]|uniref:Uncharacterized protein n=1 Tax=Choiromyces venosus 120613-1 TaxID=1336337 RepID=A0A3N4J4H1_9PEZI|nr:hypothetical protein L873DRAFT_1831372 [Choiromyces venosus 120613-1]